MKKYFRKFIIDIIGFEPLKVFQWKYVNLDNGDMGYLSIGDSAYAPPHILHIPDVDSGYHYENEMPKVAKINSLYCTTYDRDRSIAFYRTIRS